MSDDTIEPNEEPDIELDGDLDDLEIDLEMDDDNAILPEGEEDDDDHEIEVPSGVKITSEDEEEDEDEDDEVEADLDTILRERLASEDEDEDEDDTLTEGDVVEKVLVSAEGDRILSKQEDEVLCTGCFLLVKASQYDDRGGTAACPHCGTPIGSYVLGYYFNAEN